MRFILLLIAGFVLWKFLHQTVFKRHKVICRNCGTIASSKIVSPRNLFVEILLWFSGLLPGVLYTLWCHHQTYEACDKCGARDIVPADSPVGRKLAAEMAVNITPVSQDPVDQHPMSQQMSWILPQLTLYTMSNQNGKNTEFVTWMQDNGLATTVTNSDGNLAATPAVSLPNPPLMDAAQQIAAMINSRISRASVSERNLFAAAIIQH